MDDLLTPEAPAPAPAAARGCPVAHTAPPALVAPAADAAVCPFPHKPATKPVQRSRADLVVRKVLRIRERPAGVTQKSAYDSFRRSMLISATRCTLTYVVFPFVLPAIHFATGVGPILGIVIGLVAMTCDVFTIRRFFAVDHKWRWQASAVAFSVICLLSVLLVQDIVHLATN